VNPTHIQHWESDIINILGVISILSVTRPTSAPLGVTKRNRDEEHDLVINAGPSGALNCQRGLANASATSYTSTLTLDIVSGR
jgi:hypothetical protein